VGEERGGGKGERVEGGGRWEIGVGEGKGYWMRVVRTLVTNYPWNLDSARAWEQADKLA